MVIFCLYHSTCF